MRPKIGDPVVHDGRKYRIEDVSRVAFLKRTFAGGYESKIGVLVEDLVWDEGVGMWHSPGEFVKREAVKEK